MVAESCDKLIREVALSATSLISLWRTSINFQRLNNTHIVYTNRIVTYIMLLNWIEWGTFMSKQINIRLDGIHYELLEKIVMELSAQQFNANKTNVIEKALYTYADIVLTTESIKETVDNHYKSFQK